MIEQILITVVLNQIAFWTVVSIFYYLKMRKIPEIVEEGEENVFEDIINQFQDNIAENIQKSFDFKQISEFVSSTVTESMKHEINKLVKDEAVLKEVAAFIETSAVKALRENLPEILAETMSAMFGQQEGETAEGAVPAVQGIPANLAEMANFEPKDLFKLLGFQIAQNLMKNNNLLGGLTGQGAAPAVAKQLSTW